MVKMFNKELKASMNLDVAVRRWWSYGLNFLSFILVFNAVISPKAIKGSHSFQRQSFEWGFSTSAFVELPCASEAVPWHLVCGLHPPSAINISPSCCDDQKCVQTCLTVACRTASFLSFIPFPGLFGSHCSRIPMPIFRTHF